jgi:hypothetical protein
MLDRIPYDAATSAFIGVSATPIHDLIERRGEALWEAALLLGGQEAARSVGEVIDHLDHEARPCRRCRTLLGDLLEILSLKHAHDFDRPEAAFLAAVDPADPIVEDLCLLTDELREALDAQDTIDALSARPIRRAA